ncbi:unnamed protein product [Candidula unifasciata]|uniref:G-protein coupled receptors family 1 profile domain-containing protein n=1 Tax=Candidula unifasciata TaxID=100452 RepID=A0A8S4A8C9_9EUPU|nr:unnamed protein product [Candidula unifasciata]
MDNDSGETNITAHHPDISDVYSNHLPSILINRLFTLIFYIIGLPANPVCAYIWLQQKTRANNSSAIYLGALSISHVVFLALHILQELRYAWGISIYDGYVSCEIFNMLFCIPQYLAPLLVLGFTVERYIAVCHPFAKERFCTVRRAVLVVICLLAVCIIISTLQAYFWTYDEVKKICNHRQELQASPFIEIWTWSTELLLFGVAPLAALVFNILVIREIRSLTTSGPAHLGVSVGSQTSTVTLLSVSFYLICTWLPYTIVYSMYNQFPIGPFPIQPEAVQADPTWRRHLMYILVRNFLTEITLSNSACYFFIYYATGKYFRQRVHELLCPASWLQTKDSSHPKKSYLAISSTAFIKGKPAACV